MFKYPNENLKVGCDYEGTIIVKDSVKNAVH